MTVAVATFSFGSRVTASWRRHRRRRRLHCRRLYFTDCRYIVVSYPACSVDHIIVNYIVPTIQWSSILLCRRLCQSPLTLSSSTIFCVGNAAAVTVAIAVTVAPGSGGGGNPFRSGRASQHQGVVAVTVIYLIIVDYTAVDYISVDYIVVNNATSTVWSATAIAVEHQSRRLYCRRLYRLSPTKTRLQQHCRRLYRLQNYNWSSTIPSNNFAVDFMYCHQPCSRRRCVHTS